MRVLVTGSTGFVGSRLCSALRAAGHAVSSLSRSPGRRRAGGADRVHSWDPLASPPPAEALEGVDAVVNLAGENVAGRWSGAKRQAIRDSRVVGTRHLIAGLGAAGSRPEVLVSASAIGYYGDRGDEVLTEEAAAGSGFLAEVCKAWEREAEGANGFGIRVVRLRIGIVLGPGGGALQSMLLPARLGLAGPLGSGRQWWSWVHHEDLVALILHALEGDLRGPYNATAPQPVRQRQFASELGAALRRPAFVPTPGFLLRLVLGGFAGELLSSARVACERAQEAGYEFRFITLASALRDLLS